MLNIGPAELVMICVIALIVLGPDKLPQAMRTAGQVMNQLRNLSNGFQQDLAHAFQEETTSDPRRSEPNRAKGNGESPIDAPESSAEDVSSGDPADEHSGDPVDDPVKDEPGPEPVAELPADDGPADAEVPEESRGVDEGADGNSRVA